MKHGKEALNKGEIRPSAPKCVLFAPHDHIAQTARQVCRIYNLPHEIVSCNTVTIAIEMAKKYIMDGTMVIVSRGGMARDIAAQVPIPVIPIEVTFIDLVDVLDKLKHRDKRIGVMISTDFTYDMEKVRRFMGISVEKIEVGEDSNIIDTITEAKKKGINFIVGGTTPIYFAEAAGIEAAHLDSGIESIRAAFAQAELLIRLEEQSRLNDNSLRHILDFLNEGLLITNANNEIVLLNKSAEKLLGINRESVLGKLRQDALPFLPHGDAHESGQIGDWCKVNGNPLLQNSAPFFRDNQVGGTISSLYSARLLDSFRANEQQELHLKGHVAQYSFDNIITKNKHMLGIVARAKSFSQVNSTILITGETGTGKEMFAQSIHNASNRRHRPFVAINCASIPDSILESELFGYEAGAFTGATKGGKKGYFEMAEGGTLFMDEIGEIAPNLQSKLLRVLQQREIVRVGGDRVIPVNLRIIVATLVDMAGEVREGRFRRDLYYRLNVLRLSIPPLRERLDDLPLLIKELAKKTSDSLNLPPIRIEGKLLAKFRAYPWLGNIRELENALERLTIIQNEQGVSQSEVDMVLEDMRVESAVVDEPKNLRDIEKNTILDCLRTNNWDRAKVCKTLGISQATLWRRLKEWEIQIDEN